MSMSPKIYQIYYREEQKKRLDPVFTPYDNAGDDHALLEFNVFRKIFQSGEVGQTLLWGAVSWKFKEKTGMSGGELLKFIDAHPGYDVYYCNPYPQFEALYHNYWVHGETAHPNFLQLSRAIFDIAGLPVAMMTAMQPGSAFAATNYIVAKQAFWEGYFAFIEGIVEKIHAHAPTTILDKLYSSEADMKGAHAGSGYLPFVIERLFSVFLMTEVGQGIRAIKYPVPGKEAKLNIHLKHLREMKDAACRHRSPWLGSCWVNYRNLYLADQHDKVWLNKYLMLVTPREIRFLDFPEIGGLRP